MIYSHYYCVRVFSLTSGMVHFIMDFIRWDTLQSVYRGQTLTLYFTMFTGTIGELDTFSDLFCLIVYIFCSFVKCLFHKGIGPASLWHLPSLPYICSVTLARLLRPSWNPLVGICWYEKQVTSPVRWLCNIASQLTACRSDRSPLLDVNKVGLAAHESWQPGFITLP